MFELVFYESKRGDSPIADYLDSLQQKAATDKNARIRRRKILAYMAALAERGTSIGQPYVKHIEEDIWELRPLDDRVFFFYWKDNHYVLLHHFQKKSQKTPRLEIEKEKRNRDDWLERNEL